MLHDSVKMERPECGKKISLLCLKQLGIKEGEKQIFVVLKCVVLCLAKNTVHNIAVELCAQRSS